MMSLRSSNIKLSEAGEYLINESVSKSTYVKHPICESQNRQKEAKLKFLQESHFKLGSDNSEHYLPEYKAAYKEQEGIKEPIDNEICKDARGSHLKYLFTPIRTRHANNNLQSMYQERMSEPIKQGRIINNHCHSDVRKVNFSFGNDKPDFSTEAREK